MRLLKAKTPRDVPFEALIMVLDDYQSAVTTLSSEETYKSKKVSVKSRIIPLKKK